MLYYFKKGKNTTEIQKRICAVYGEGAVTDQRCQKWFAKFHARDLLDCAPWSGRPVEIDGNQIETLIENNQWYPMSEIADVLKISKSIKLVKMKSMSFILQKKPYGLFGNPVLFPVMGKEKPFWRIFPLVVYDLWFSVDLWFSYNLLFFCLIIGRLLGLQSVFAYMPQRKGLSLLIFLLCQILLFSPRDP